MPLYNPVERMPLSRGRCDRLLFIGFGGTVKPTTAAHPRITAATVSFHRPLQYYVKALAKAGFVIEKLEEWTSLKESTSGPRAKAENDARKEFPLFLYLGVKKIGGT